MDHCPEVQIKVHSDFDDFIKKWVWTERVLSVLSLPFK